MLSVEWILVENRFIGIKSRGIERPAQRCFGSSPRSRRIGDGQPWTMARYDDPKICRADLQRLLVFAEMDFIMSAFNKSQNTSTPGDGGVILRKCRSSAGNRQHRCMTKNSSSMEEGGLTQRIRLAFNINPIRLKANNLVLRKKRPYNWRVCW